jgi:hypothetical protein
VFWAIIGGLGASLLLTARSRCAGGRYPKSERIGLGAGLKKRDIRGPLTDRIVQA